MNKVQAISAFDQIKLLADSRRMEILRLLMAAPATLTQLARTLGQSPAWVRHHILALESANLIELAETRLVGKVTEKYYRAKASALLLQEVILPKTDKPVLVFSGSHDLALETVADQLSRHVTLLNLSVGSLDGLVNLRQGLCQVSGAHLLDESGEYNTPFVRHLFPDHEMEIITLTYRTQGLILDIGNPKAIQGIPDLAREDIRFINRNPGSGTRLWFDQELKRLGISPEEINGYGYAVKTHSEAAALVARGLTDAAIGLQAAAHQHNLDFIPLFDERYDLILPSEQEENLLPLLDYIQTAAFRHDVDALTGYNTSHSGERISSN
jgi:putative molybdopterin biosynthesis protein